jgi:hypothetical protein
VQIYFKPTHDFGAFHVFELTTLYLKLKFIHWNFQNLWLTKIKKLLIIDFTLKKFGPKVIRGKNDMECIFLYRTKSAFKIYIKSPSKRWTWNEKLSSCLYVIFVHPGVELQTLSRDTIHNIIHILHFLHWHLPHCHRMQTKSVLTKIFG